MKLLIFGRTGQVATELREQVGPGQTVTALGRDQADLSDPGACAKIIQDAEADVIINAAAYTAVDKAEAEEDLAHTINAAAPAAMARAAARRGIPFLQVSTDYVYDGADNEPFLPARWGPMAEQNWQEIWV